MTKQAKTPDDNEGVIIRRKKAHDYVEDPANMNIGSRRGQKLLKESYEQLQAGRSWLVDADDMLIAGNHARQAAIDAGIIDVVEVEVNDPRIQVVVKRPDLDLDSETDNRARILAAADNRTRDLSEWDPHMVAEHEALLRDNNLFRQDEIDDLLMQGDVEAHIDAELDGEYVAARNALTGKPSQVEINVMVDDLDIVERSVLMAKSLTGQRVRGKLFAHICQHFIDAHTDDEIEGLLNDSSG